MLKIIKLPILITSICLLTLGFTFKPYQSISWSIPQKIEGVWDSGHLHYEILADNEGYVHLFWEQVENGFHSLNYSFWDGTVWSFPNDIILSPIGGSVTILSTVLGEDGTIYIVFFGGNQDNGNYYLTRSRSSDAGSARSWSQPVELANSIGAGAALTIDQEDQLHLLYVDVIDIETSIQHMVSPDGGVTWTTPETIFLDTSNINIPEIITTIDGRGRIHAVWTTFDNQAFGQYVYYTRWESNLWSPVRTAAQKDPDEFGVGYPFIIAIGNDIIHMTWQDGLVPPKRYANWSEDGGNTWSQPEEVFGVVGQNGRVGPMAVDSAGQLHAITHGRYGNPPTHGIFYIPWLGRSWGLRIPIAEGTPQEQYDPQNLKLVAYLGNQLIAVYGNDPHRGLWYSTAQTGALYTAPIPYPTITPAPTLTPSPEPLGAVVDVEPTSVPSIISSSAGISAGRPTGNLYPIMLGGISAFLISGIVIYIKILRNRS